MNRSKATSKRILVAGGAGFIGSNFVRYVLETHPEWYVINLDKLTYAGNLANLEDVAGNPRYSFVEGDIADRGIIDRIMSAGVHAMVNFAAESHVDRSIIDPAPFMDTNIKGTQVLLEGAKAHGVSKFVHVSTDEVYGALGAEGEFSEDSPLAPNSPYAASKAAADMLCRAYYHTYGLPVVITRSSNNYGPYQHPEKLIPLVITNALEGKPVPMYGKGTNVRDWIFVEDHCRALDLVLREGKPGQVYNVGADCQRDNIGLVYDILDIMGKPRALVQFVTDRPGHDWRYALDVRKITSEFAWRPLFSMGEWLHRTVKWYVEHESWWRSVKSGDYLTYYERMYRGRSG